MGLKWLIAVAEEQAPLEQRSHFRFLALDEAIRRAGRQLAYREHLCADVALVRMASDQSDVLD